MGREEEVAKKLEEYKELAKNNPDVDVASLMMSAMESVDQNTLSVKEKRLAYVVSLLFPPFGLIFAAKFYFGEKNDGKYAALVCVILTVISFLLTYVLIKTFTSTAGVSVQQIEQIRPEDVQQLLQ